MNFIEIIKNKMGSDYDDYENSYDIYIKYLSFMNSAESAYICYKDFSDYLFVSGDKVKAKEFYDKYAKALKDYLTYKEIVAHYSENLKNI